jgi:hypothetical protein
MARCTQCGSELRERGNFCSVCGISAAPPMVFSAAAGAGAGAATAAHPYPQPQPYSQPPAAVHHPAARGFAQVFGLHPATALLTVVVNTMIFGTAGIVAISTGGLGLIPLTFVSTVCGVILGVITYMAQRKWYNDDKESAVIKALIVGFLTAIPVGLPGYLVIPSGIVGFFRHKD